MASGTKEPNQSLGDFLREVSNWNWEEFCRAENDPSYTSNEAMVFALVRACAMEKLEAIKLAVNRVDGKLKTPIKIEYPKIFFLYPQATLVQSGDIEPPASLHRGDIADEPAEDDMKYELLKTEPPDGTDPEPPPDLPSLSLRQTVAKMADAPRQVPQFVMEYATATQQWLQGHGEEPIEKPLVKSVVAAHLLGLAQKRNIEALTEVFDQIDGKLVETIQILGEDIFITSYSHEAPDGAYLNADGVLQLEAAQAQSVWAEKLGNK